MLLNQIAEMINLDQYSVLHPLGTSNCHCWTHKLTYKQPVTNLINSKPASWSPESALYLNIEYLQYSHIPNTIRNPCRPNKLFTFFPGLCSFITAQLILW